MKKSKLSIKEHMNVGKALKDMRDKLVHFHVLIGNAYPVKSKQLARLAAASKAIDALRSELDNVVHSEVGSSDGIDPARIYYPGNGQ